MKPLLIYKDENAIENANNQLYETQGFWQNIVDQYNNLELGEDKKLNGNDLVLFVTNPKSFIVDKITQGENLAIGSIPISKDKAFEILELPSQLHQIISEVEKISLGNHSGRFLIRNQTPNFTINNEMVEFTEEYIQSTEKANSIFITTEQQKQAWELMQEIATKINALRTITQNNGIYLNPLDLDLFFGINDKTGLDSINIANPEVIKRLN